MEFLRFKHARFSARFPRDYRYSPSHYWMCPADGETGVWRVGFTKFATRMLGELVEASFEVELGAVIAPGQEIGTVEGFKAASAVYAVMGGVFSGMNPVLTDDACVVRSDPYESGWLYAVRGAPEADALDAAGYIEYLGETIARMAAAGHESADG